VKLTTHLQLVPRFRKCSIHPLPHTPLWRSAYLVKHRDNFILNLERYSLLDCNAVQFGKNLTFWRNISLPSSGPKSNRSTTLALSRLCLPPIIAAFFLGLLFESEDGGRTPLRNAGGLRTTRCFNLANHTSHRHHSENLRSKIIGHVLFDVWITRNGPQLLLSAPIKLAILYQDLELRSCTVIWGPVGRENKLVIVWSKYSGLSHLHSWLYYGTIETLTACCLPFSCFLSYTVEPHLCSLKCVCKFNIFFL
jgi:hypothetical protein